MGFTYIVTVFFLAIAYRTALSKPGSVGAEQDGPPVDACPQSTGWTYHYGHYSDPITCYYFSSIASPNVTTKTWEDAQDACKNIITIGEKTVGLAAFGSKYKGDADIWVMELIVLQGVRVWLGAERPDGNTVFFWHNRYVKGEPPRRSLSLSYPLWGPKQPNNHNGVKQNCLSTLEEEGRYPRRQYLNDADCNEKLHYVCQIFK